MSKSMSTVSVNVPTSVKQQATKIFGNLGLSMSSGVNVFLKRVVSERGIPFELKEIRPSEDFKAALNELSCMQKHPDQYESFNSVDELLKDLESND